MRSYECLYIVHPAADTAELNSSAQKYSETIQGKGGTLKQADIWGKRALAFPINHHTDGSYILLRFDAEPEAVTELQWRLRVDDRVLRHMVSYEIPEGAGRSDELMVLTEKKDRDRRGRGRGRGRSPGRFRRDDRDRGDERGRPDRSDRPAGARPAEARSGASQPAADRPAGHAPAAPSTTREGGDD
ncbi:MAG: 30S ribosomal protein S6 [Candidatus Krumholzibacteriota bacterium]|nr:30S ribosomal protein S6 [Candidatus Krumholzibacteriota bacterium]